MTNQIKNSIRSFLLLVLLGMMPFALAENFCNTGKTGGKGGIGGTGNADVVTGCTSNKQTDSRKGGIGGTGNQPSADGIGGTGNQAATDGIGGTGNQAATDGIGGTGIIGIITDFGSIWVNGIRVQYDATTPVQAYGATVAADKLALGQVVAVEATGSENVMRAKQITVLNVVTGPIGEINLVQNQITVLGQVIRVTSETHNTALQDLKIGDPVRISGLRETRGIIVATRIDPAPRDVMEVTGRVDKLVNNGFNIANLPVSAAAITGLEVGREVRVAGTWDGQQLHARQIKIEPVLPFDGKIEQLSLQGYVATFNNQGRIRLGAAEIEIPKNLAVPGTDGLNNSNSSASTDSQPEMRIHVRVRIDADRRLVAERIEVERHVQGQDRRIQQELNSGKSQKNHAELPVRDGHSNRDSGGEVEEDGHRHPERADRADRADRAESIRHSESGSGSGRDHPEDN